MLASWLPLAMRCFAEKNPIKILWFLVAKYLSQWGEIISEFIESFYPFNFHDILRNKC